MESANYILRAWRTQDRKHVYYTGHCAGQENGPVSLDRAEAAKYSASYALHCAATLNRQRNDGLRFRAIEAGSIDDHTMDEQPAPIVTSHYGPGYWVAARENWEHGDPVGGGKNERAAIEALLDEEDEAAKPVPLVNPVK